MRSMVEGASEPRKMHEEPTGIPRAKKKRRLCPLRLASLATSPARRGRNRCPAPLNDDFREQSLL
jgi:hypothetical protein